MGARSATVADLDLLSELAAQARQEVSGLRGGELLLADVDDDRARLADSLADDAAIVLVGTIDRVAVGYAMATACTTRTGTRLATVSDIWVDPGARAVGVGECLLDSIVSFAEQQGCQGIDAIALPGARETKNFFESFGLTARAIIVNRSLA